MLCIKLFGPLCASAEGHRLHPRDFGGVKPKQVLEILLLARGRPVAKDRIADLLWGEDLPRNVAATLETYVSVLRRRLGTLPGGNRLVLTEPGAYRLDRSLYRLDLDRFDVLAVEIAATPAGRAGPLLREALVLAEGEVLADEPYAEWASEVRESYRDRHTDLVLRAAQEALIHRDFHAALDHARRGVELAPLSEQAWRNTMVALHALARRNSALQAFERCRRILAEELGVDPADETVALAAAIKRGTAPDVLLPPGLPTLPADPTTMPPPVSPCPLFGREDVLAQVADQVEKAMAGAFALVLIEGQAGMGKTRVLEEAVRRLEASGRTLRVGRAYGHALERRLPGVLLGDALREALAEWEDIDEVLVTAVRGGGEGRLALDRLAAAIIAASPLVLVLDDLHHADPLSLCGLAFLARRCRRAPVGVLASVRPEEVGGDHPLRRLVPDARLRLGAIEAHHVPGLSLDLWAKTGGHPQFLAECFAAGQPDGAAGWPPGLVDAVLSRSHEAGRRARRLLISAAVFSGPFLTEDLAAALGTSPLDLVEDLERLCERRFLVEEGPRFAFRSEIVREVLLASMSPARRDLISERVRTLTTRPSTAALITA